MAPLHSRDADLLQVTLGEGQEDAEVHVLLLKQLQVLQTPDLLQQSGKVLEARGRDRSEASGPQRHGDKKSIQCSAEPLLSC